MLIENLQYEKGAERTRVSATVTWEDAGFASREIFFETDSEFGDDLAPDPNAFLLAAFVPAMTFGEARVRVEGRLCPQLREGLSIVDQQLRQWYGGEDRAVTLEATQGFAPSAPPDTRRIACCMSGGVDSLASLWRNKLDFPPQHPGAVKDLLFIHGFDLGGHEAWEHHQEAYECARERLSGLARGQEMRLLPLYSNLRCLEEAAPGPYYTDIVVMRSFGACLAACAQAFSPRLSGLLVPSSHSVADLAPLGSHPLLDPNYSTATLDVRHDGLSRSRMQKMELLADWDEGLSVLRVCADPSRAAADTNCGRCEKCLRTMVSLLILGRLERCPTFEANDLVAADIDRLWSSNPPADASAFGFLSYGSKHFWGELEGRLRATARADLADAVRRKLDEHARFALQQRRRARARQIDQRFFGGLISGARGMLRGRRE